MYNVLEMGNKFFLSTEKCMCKGGGGGGGGVRNLESLV